MFNENQLKTLNQELNQNRIKTRDKGNITLSYIEGFDVIETANKVFGFGNWDYAISKLEQVSQEQNQNQNNIVCYKAVVKLSIKDENHNKSISREDVGFGTGVAKTLADAHEGAAKESVTDALKRALRSFGNQFGNSLYDKSRTHQNSPHIQDTQNTNYPPQNQMQNQNNQQYQNHVPQNQTKPQQSFNQYEYQGLYNLGLNIVEKNGFLIVTGDDIYSKKDSIKACGFRFDAKTKSWYKQLDQGAA
jgi:DNA repair and recombination protein RAD52